MHHRFCDLNGVPLNDTHFALEANVIEYWEAGAHECVQQFSWMTDLPIDESNQRCCRLFQAAVIASKDEMRLWLDLRAGFTLCLFPIRC